MLGKRLFFSRFPPSNETHRCRRGSGRANTAGDKKFCSIGLEGWKIVSRFNYILFRFFPPREVNRLTPPLLSISHSSPLKSFHVFSSFFFFSFHLNENHLNIIVIFFRSSEIVSLPSCSPPQFEFIQNGWDLSSSFFQRNVCGKSSLSRNLRFGTLCVCVDEIAEESTCKGEERIKI